MYLPTGLLKVSQELFLQYSFTIIVHRKCLIINRIPDAYVHLSLLQNHLLSTHCEPVCRDRRQAKQ